MQPALLPPVRHLFPPKPHKCPRAPLQVDERLPYDGAARLVPQHHRDDRLLACELEAVRRGPTRRGRSARGGRPRAHAVLAARKHKVRALGARGIHIHKVLRALDENFQTAAPGERPRCCAGGRGHPWLAGLKEEGP
jgi:hypothetical protein